MKTKNTVMRTTLKSQKGLRHFCVVMQVMIGSIENLMMTIMSMDHIVSWAQGRKRRSSVIVKSVHVMTI